MQRAEKIILRHVWQRCLALFLSVIGAGAGITYWLSVPDAGGTETSPRPPITSAQSSPAKTPGTPPLEPIKSKEDPLPTDAELPDDFWPQAGKFSKIPPAKEEEKPAEPQGKAHVFVVHYQEPREKYNIVTSDRFLNEGNLSDVQNPDMLETGYPIDFSRVITTSKVIPAVLYTEIDSEIPSNSVRAQVEQDIVGYQGWTVLIPKGSWVIGRYKPLKKYGDTRLNLEWYRILTPEGIHIELTAEASDAIGNAGITGEVDNKFLEKYGMALLLATINAGAQLTVETNNEKNRSISNAFSNPLSDVTNESLRQGMRLAPTVHIKRGERIMIQPTVDLYFPEPKSERIIAEPLPKIDLLKRNLSTQQKLEKEAETEPDEPPPPRKSSKRKRKKG